MASMTEFVHLRLHTEFSLLDSVVRVPELMRAVATANMSAVGLSDEHNLFALVKFYRAALANGIKPVIGVDLWLRENGERASPSRFTLFCQDDRGYRNVTRLLTRAWLEGQTCGQPLVDRAWLTRETTTGLIALSGGVVGDVGRQLANARDDDADVALQRWLHLFGDRYYLEVSRIGGEQEERANEQTVRLATRRGVPVVATNDVRFIAARDFESHEARVCIHDGMLLADPSRPRKYTAQQYLRTPAEMAELFADLPEALQNSVEIARRCSLPLRLGESRLPQYPVPEGLSTEDFLRAQAKLGLQRRLRATPTLDGERYRVRLEEELAVITPMGFSGYFLIVADFIRWARENGVPVGPGRGSGAGSLVAYSLAITDIDPLKYDLLFERFLNPERVSMPDFDVDFCMEGRDRVIDYVSQKYGRERVSQIITYGTMAAKAVVRDVGRVLGMSYGQVDRIAKLIPFELEMTLESALEKEPELRRLYNSDDEVRNLLDLARSLEGLTRNAGKHAGGVVIAPSVLTDFAPLYCEEGGANVVTQFDKDDVEAVGLVKFDFLGLRTLTIIDSAVRTINREAAQRGESAIDITQLPTDDAPTYALLKSHQTTAVFQLESRGMKDLIRRLQPDCFEDIIALVALFRPGPLQSGMVDDFIARKQDKTNRTVDYLHPLLEPVLRPTYGVILYQEQVMQIAQVLAGYTLGGADLLRRAMGKKKAEEMAEQRDVFVDGAKARGVAQAQATLIFDLMEKFAGYGFNKSHSAAYALLSYQTAWLKAHHPAQFMAAVLSADMDNTDKVVTLKDEADHMGIKVLGPDINFSRYAFVASDQQAIRYGLGAVKGVGHAAVDAIVAQREANGPYRSLEDLCQRIDLNKLNRRLLEALIRSGSLDGLGANRATLMNRLGAALHLGEQNTRASEAGQVDLFGLPGATAASSSAASGAGFQPDWSEGIRLAGERETLGLYLTGHPINRFEKELPRLVTMRIADLISDRPSPGAAAERGVFMGKPATLAGYIHEVRKRGTRFSALLDDRSGRIEVSFRDDVYGQYRDLIVRDAVVLIEGALRFDEFSDAWRLAAKRVVELDRLRETQAHKLILRWPSGAGDEHVKRLEATLAPWCPGNCLVEIRYAAAQAQAALDLGPQWRVRPKRELIEALEALFGSDNVRVITDHLRAKTG